MDDSRFDLVFSFDSLVHAEIDGLKSCVPQIIQKLNNDGVAFIHHSNVFAFGTALSQTFGRGASVSRENVEGLVDSWIRPSPNKGRSALCIRSSPLVAG